MRKITSGTSFLILIRNLPHLLISFLQPEIINSPLNLKEMPGCIDDLPETVLYHIFSFLNPYFLVMNIRLVSNSWKLILEGSSFWKTIEFLSLHEPTLGALFIETTIAKCRNLKTLDITFSNERFYNPLRHLTIAGASLPRLQSLSLLSTYPGVCSSIVNIVKGAPNLHKVRVEGDLTQVMVDAISQLKKLSSIDISVYDDEDGEDVSFTQIFQNCAELQHVKISTCYISNETEELKCLVTHHSTSLKGLTWFVPLYDDGVRLISRCTALSQLTIGCDELSDISLKLIQNLPLLSSLSLCNSCAFTSDAIKQLLDCGSCLNLKILTLMNLENINDTVLHAISHNFPNLEALHLEGYNSTTLDGLRHLLEHCPNIRLLKLLTPKFDFSFLNDLPTYLPQLIYLDVFEAPIDEDLVNNFIQFHPLFQMAECSRLYIEDTCSLYQKYLTGVESKPVLIYCDKNYEMVILGHPH